MLDEQVTFVHQAERPFMILTFLAEFGGLSFGLLIVGYALTRLTQAKTLFLIRFTEDVFRQAANSPTKFDSADENSVRPLKGKGAMATPKMQLLKKVALMCTNKIEEPLEPLYKGDTEVMWNEFLRFRQRIKYNIMGVILCCCTRK